MICISVTPESRKLAKVDLFNAAGQCDLIELCVDRLVKEPNFTDLLGAAQRPVLISCRRTQDGGQFKGTEEQRTALLRQAIVAGPAYIELDLDIAPSIPRFGNVKRVISHTSLNEPLGNIDSIFQQASQANADVVKFTWPTPTLEAAWPLLSAVSQKRKIPVVGLGLGKSGLTFSLLGRKHGSPWIYAALEQGMEAFEGQPTVGELDSIYGWRRIDSNTRFVAIAGFGFAEATAAKILNAGFDQIGMNMRCLPLEFATAAQLPKMLDILKIHAVVVTRSAGRRILSLAERLDEIVRQAQFADLVAKTPEGWQAYNVLWKCAVRALESKLGKTSPEDRPLDRRNVLIIGTGGLAQSLALGIQQRSGLVSVSGADDEETQNVAQLTGARFVPTAQLYDTLVDVIVFTESTMDSGRRRVQINPSLMRSGLTVLDVSELPSETALTSEGRERGCKVVEPAEIYADYVGSLFKSLTGQELPAEAFRAGLLSE